MEEQPAPGLDIGLWAGLRELYSRLSSARHREFVILLGFMFLGAIAELATVGSVIPFLALISQQSGVHLPRPLGAIAALGPALGLTGVVATGIVFGAFAIVAGVIRLELAWLTQDFVNRGGNELALEIQRRILAQPYSFHVERHSSTFISATDKVEIVVLDLGLPLLQTIIAIFIGLFLLAALFAINALATVIATASFALIYVLVSAVVGKRLAANSAVVGTAYHERVRVEQESLGGIRDVIIDNSQAMHLDTLARVNARLVGARATTNFMAQAPRFIVEAAGVVVVVVIAVLLSRQAGGIALAIPFLGALAVGAQRLLPLIQTAYAGWSVAAANRSIVGQIVELLRLPMPRDEERLTPLALKDRISFDQVSFSYPARPAQPAIDNVSLDIRRGSMVAFIGKTGSGKTTLADLLMGLMQPTGGRILVDQTPLTPENARRWQKSIAHVPQAIFLADMSIAANVALSKGREPQDPRRIAEALKMAQLDDFVASLPNGYDTVVGERGIRLSGGQRQRLGLARAIYKDAPVLVLDEATSALDEHTESIVVETLERLKEDGRTIVIIAHRMSTISRCDLIVRLDEGRLVDAGSIGEVAGPSARLRSGGQRRARSGATRRPAAGKGERVSGN